MPTWLRSAAAASILIVGLGLYVEDALVTDYEVPLPFWTLLMIVVASLFPEGSAAIIRWWRNGGGKGNGNGN